MWQLYILRRFKTSGLPRGFAFVEFGSKKAADSALAAFAPTEEDLVPPPPTPGLNNFRRRLLFHL